MTLMQQQRRHKSAYGGFDVYSPAVIARFTNGDKEGTEKGMEKKNERKEKRKKRWREIDENDPPLSGAVNNIQYTTMATMWQVVSR